MIIGLHGYTNTAENFQRSFGMNSQADENNYLAVYLQATYFKDPNGADHISSWNDGDCGLSPGPEGPTCNPFSVDPVPRPVACDDPDGNSCNWCNCLVDDIAAIDLLAQMIEQTYCIDLTREYILGFSQGGMLTHSVACELADRFAAAAPFHGARHIGFDCEPKDNITMPLFEVWGTKDQEVPGQTVLSQDGWYYIPVSNVQEKFAVHNGCNLSNGVKHVKTVSDGIESWTCIGWHQGCTNNASTVSCSWAGTHTYPMRGQTNFGLSAAWEFLQNFKRIPPKSASIK
eukprot:CAMPEP_0201574254 /NCGR_PEP_ID=MMETSP0190_2-20130828/18637_1 /ASSEMBLY_ACC=CAM_ASM_000263 /TAXON_ID=37353 /ORGANISM="Rosalina sp." /LENGTH=286 /DNA_ID=CAMNT_0048002263 /DNA_START=217 /DNA_END=1077 /DNA_ORIENTATION=-